MLIPSSVRWCWMFMLIYISIIRAKVFFPISLPCLLFLPFLQFQLYPHDYERNSIFSCMYWLSWFSLLRIVYLFFQAGILYLFLVPFAKRKPFAITSDSRHIIHRSIAGLQHQLCLLLCVCFFKVFTCFVFEFSTTFLMISFYILSVIAMCLRQRWCLKVWIHWSRCFVFTRMIKNINYL